MIGATVRGGLIITASLFLLPLQIKAAGSGEPALTVYYSASLNGNLDGCDCKSSPKSGLVKRASYLREETDRDSRILVDAGDIFHYRPDLLLAEEILAGYSELGYDLVSVGDQELSVGASAFLEHVEAYPFLSSNNLQICPDPERCVFVSLGPTVVERGEMTVGLFALTHPDVYRLYPPELRETVKVSDPLHAAQGALIRLEDAHVDLTILVYHASVESAAEIAEAFPEIDVIVVGHDQRTVDAERIGETILVSPGQDGNNLGALELRFTETGEPRWKNRFVTFDYEQDPDDAAIRARIDAYLKRLTEAAAH